MDMPLGLTFGQFRQKQLEIVSKPVGIMSLGIGGTAMLRSAVVGLTSRWGLLHIITEVANVTLYPVMMCLPGAVVQCGWPHLVQPACITSHLVRSLALYCVGVGLAPNASAIRTILQLHIEMVLDIALAFQDQLSLPIMAVLCALRQVAWMSIVLWRMDGEPQRVLIRGIFNWVIMMLVQAALEVRTWSSYSRYLKLQQQRERQQLPHGLSSPPELDAAPVSSSDLPSPSKDGASTSSMTCRMTWEGEEEALAYQDIGLRRRFPTGLETASELEPNLAQKDGPSGASSSGHLPDLLQQAGIAGPSLGQISLPHGLEGHKEVGLSRVLHGQHDEPGEEKPSGSCASPEIRPAAALAAAQPSRLTSDQQDASGGQVTEDVMHAAERNAFDVPGMSQLSTTGRHQRRFLECELFGSAASGDQCLLDAGASDPLLTVSSGPGTPQSNDHGAAQSFAPHASRFSDLPRSPFMQLAGMQTAPQNLIAAEVFQQLKLTAQELAAAGNETISADTLYCRHEFPPASQHKTSTATLPARPASEPQAASADRPKAGERDGPVPPSALSVPGTTARTDRFTASVVSTYGEAASNLGSQQTLEPAADTGRGSCGEANEAEMLTVVPVAASVRSSQDLTGTGVDNQSLEPTQRGSAVALIQGSRAAAAAVGLGHPRGPAAAAAAAVAALPPASALATMRSARAILHAIEMQRKPYARNLRYSPASATVKVSGVELEQLPPDLPTRLQKQLQACMPGMAMSGLAMRSGCVMLTLDLLRLEELPQNQAAGSHTGGEVTLAKGIMDLITRICKSEGVGQLLEEGATMSVQTSDEFVLCRWDSDSWTCQGVGQPGNTPYLTYSAFPTGCRLLAAHPAVHCLPASHTIPTASTSQLTFTVQLQLPSSSRLHGWQPPGRLVPAASPAQLQSGMVEEDGAVFDAALLVRRVGVAGGYQPVAVQYKVSAADAAGQAEAEDTATVEVKVDLDGPESVGLCLELWCMKTPMPITASGSEASGSQPGSDGTHWQPGGEPGLELLMAQIPLLVLAGSCQAAAIQLQQHVVLMGGVQPRHTPMLMQQQPLNNHLSPNSPAAQQPADMATLVVAPLSVVPVVSARRNNGAIKSDSATSAVVENLTILPTPLLLRDPATGSNKQLRPASASSVANTGAGFSSSSQAPSVRSSSEWIGIDKYVPGVVPPRKVTHVAEHMEPMWGTGLASGSPAQREGMCVDSAEGMCGLAQVYATSPASLGTPSPSPAANPARWADFRPLPAPARTETGSTDSIPPTLEPPAAPSTSLPSERNKTGSGPEPAAGTSADDSEGSDAAYCLLEDLGMWLAHTQLVSDPRMPCSIHKAMDAAMAQLGCELLVYAVQQGLGAVADWLVEGLQRAEQQGQAESSPQASAQQLLPGLTPALSGPSTSAGPSAWLHRATYGRTHGCASGNTSSVANQLEGDGMGLLHAAMASGVPAVVEQVLRWGVLYGGPDWAWPWDLATAQGCTALHLAAVQPSCSAMLETVSHVLGSNQAQSVRAAWLYCQGVVVTAPAELHMLVTQPTIDSSVWGAEASPLPTSTLHHEALPAVSASSVGHTTRVSVASRAIWAADDDTACCSSPQECNASTSAATEKFVQAQGPAGAASSVGDNITAWLWGIVDVWTTSETSEYRAWARRQMSGLVQSWAATMVFTGCVIAMLSSVRAGSLKYEALHHVLHSMGYVLLAMGAVADWRSLMVMTHVFHSLAFAATGFAPTRACTTWIQASASGVDWVAIVVLSATMDQTPLPHLLALRLVEAYFHSWACVTAGLPHPLRHALTIHGCALAVTTLARTRQLAAYRRWQRVAAKKRN